MRNLLTLVGAAVVTFAVVGWFLGWYQIKTTPGPDGHRQVNIDINGPKITEDLQKGRTKLLNILQQNGQPNPAAPTAPGLSGPAPQTPPAGGAVIVRPAAGNRPTQDPQGGSWFYLPQR